MARDLNKILKELETQGFTHRRTKKGHRVVTKDARIVAVFACTPSDPRSVKNSLADCKRAGFVWPPAMPTSRKVHLQPAYA